MDVPGDELIIGGAALLAVLAVYGVARFCFGIGRVGRDMARHAPTRVPYIPNERDLRMLIRLPMGERFGTPEEQERNALFTRAVDDVLVAHGIGAVMRAFVARGVVYFNVGRLAPAEWDGAFNVVRSALDRLDLSGVAVVVRREEFPGDPHPFFEPIWPDGYHGDFYDVQTNTGIRFG